LDGTAQALEFWSIGELSAELGVSPRAIRLYEQEGLLNPRRAGQNRVYSHGDRARLILILRGKRLGFALADIKELLSLYDADRDHLTQLRATLEKGRKRIAELERQREEITATIDELKGLERVTADLIRQKESQRGKK
jgi:DNA-binding transcriptional MerR regulator